MTDAEDRSRLYLRNVLLGRWAAERLGLVGADAERYAQTLGEAAYDLACADVCDEISRDINAAGLACHEEDILLALNEAATKAGKMLATGPGDSTDRAGLALARKLMR